MSGLCDSAEVTVTKINSEALVALYIFVQGSIGGTSGNITNAIIIGN